MSKIVSASFAQLYPLIREAIDRGNRFTFTAFGSSMKPYIRNGKDRVTLSPLQSTPVAGDVIFYRREDGSFVLHRVIHKRGDHLILCGDNQFISEAVAPSQVIARLSHIERNGRCISPEKAFSRLYFHLLPIRRFSLRCLYHAKRVAKRMLKYFKNN